MHESTFESLNPEIPRYTEFSFGAIIYYVSSLIAAQAAYFYNSVISFSKWGLSKEGSNKLSSTLKKCFNTYP